MSIAMLRCAGVARAVCPTVHMSLRRRSGRPPTFTRALSGGTGLAPRTPEDKHELVEELLAVKHASGKSFNDIAAETGLTNAYCVQLFLNQAQLKPATAEKLRAAVPGLTDDMVAAMSAPPLRSFDDRLLDEPLVYRFQEAIAHYGEALKLLINEDFGDGIMSAIDFFLTVEKVKGVAGEDRVVVTFNGKFLPHVEQIAANNTAKK